MAQEWPQGRKRINAKSHPFPARRLFIKFFGCVGF
jgi:hypothetical protein